MDISPVQIRKCGRCRGGAGGGGGRRRRRRRREEEEEEDEVFNDTIERPRAKPESGREERRQTRAERERERGICGRDHCPPPGPLPAIGAAACQRQALRHWVTGPGAFPPRCWLEHSGPSLARAGALTAHCTREYHGTDKVGRAPLVLGAASCWLADVSSGGGAERCAAVATPQQTRQPAKQGRPAAVSKKSGSEEGRPRARPVHRYKVSRTTLFV